MHQLVGDEVGPGLLALAPDLEGQLGPTQEAHDVEVVVVLVGQHGARVLRIAHVQPEGHSKLLHR